MQRLEQPIRGCLRRPRYPSSHSKYEAFRDFGKKATNQRDQVRQVGTEVNSGGQFTVVAGQDLTLVSSSIAANDEAYLVAGGKVQLLAAQDYDYSFSEKRGKKLWA